MRILVFGDSITQGFWDSRGGWAERLREHYDDISKKDLDGSWTVVFNLGVDGNEVPQIAKRLAGETEARHWPGVETVIVLAVGLNDSLMQGEEENYTLDEFSENYHRLIETATEITDKVVAVGLTSVDDALCNPWKYSSSGKSYQNDRVELFNNKIREACQKTTTPFVDVFYQFKDQADQHQLFEDGLHPNDKGHELIASLVKPELDRLVK